MSWILPTKPPKIAGEIKSHGTRAARSKGGKLRMAMLTKDEHLKMSAKGSMGYLGKVSKEERSRIGKLGAKARMKKMTAQQRSSISSVNSLIRWTSQQRIGRRVWEQGSSQELNQERNRESGEAD